MPVAVLLLVAVAAGVTVGVGVRRYPRRSGVGPASVAGAAAAIGAGARRSSRLRALADARVDPSVGTGLVLTAALLLAIGGGVVLGLFAILIRTSSAFAGLDKAAAGWGHRHASATSTHVLDAITQLGNIRVVLVLCFLLVIAESIRERTIWVAAFVVAVIGGEELIANVVKSIVDRARPTLVPTAASLGPSFPSGHSATSAAFYAAAALLLGRWRPRAARALLAGAAVGIAVAVGASRVLLDLHWLSDVIAGLALGWAWFAVCGIAFGGRILRFGSAFEVAERAASETGSSGGMVDDERGERLSVLRRHVEAQPPVPDHHERRSRM
jgi:membrane-associated phospholipid phosphatase